MPTYKGLDQNYRFLVLEVHKQVQDTRRVLEQDDPALADKVLARDDYIDHLKSVIENKCFERLMSGGDRLGRDTVALLRALQIIAGNLERIGDYCSNIVSQIQYFKQLDFIKSYAYQPLFEVIDEALSSITDATFSPELRLALRLCRSEFKLDTLYKDVFLAIIDQLRHEKDTTEDLVTTLFIFRYLERIGDALLNIGEALIFAAVGEKLKVHQYEALEENLEAVEAVDDVEGMARVRIESFWESRSGCRISRVEARADDPASRWVIFKDGHTAKIRTERENIDRWEALMPGLPPRVFEYQEHDGNASMLVEFLGGDTLQSIVVNGTRASYQQAFSAVTGMLQTLWQQTKSDAPLAGTFLSQVDSRLRDVFNIHPGFRIPAQIIGGVRRPSFGELLREAATLEARLPAPFSVLTHGDMNTDNLIYDAARDQVHFIDVYRSKDGDYVQDISVYMVSNFRMPLFQPRARKRLTQAALDMLRFGQQLAQEWNDTTFDARLALGLVRSFTTSTRFQLDEEFAKAMFLRATYLLERLLAHKQEWSVFSVPDEIIEA